jgi:hypothetical protein
MIRDSRSHSFQNSSPNRDDFNFFKGAPARLFQFQSRAIVTISIPSMALNLDNNFKVSARKLHELPGNQRVLSQRIGHKQHPRARPNSADGQGKRHVKRNFTAKTTTTTTKKPSSYNTEDSTWIQSETSVTRRAIMRQSVHIRSR